jgi:hypothetical protein
MVMVQRKSHPRTFGLEYGFPDDPGLEKPRVSLSRIATFDERPIAAGQEPVCQAHHLDFRPKLLQIDPDLPIARHGNQRSAMGMREIEPDRRRTG